MSNFQRYAIYYVPDDPALATFGAAWLGWDVVAGAAAPHPDVDGVEGFTATPRKYGFHGTLKPPFRLADGQDVETLKDRLTTFTQTVAPIQLEGFRLSALGKFLALTPEGDVSELADLAFDCVRAFDTFRKPAGAEELARRRAAGLTPQQDALLVKWGYPYVGDEFRFHLTLTGKLNATDQAAAHLALQDVLPPLPRPFAFSSIALAGERDDGMFQLIHRYALTG